MTDLNPKASDLVVVSNRRPFSIKKGPKGPLIEKSAGGLVAAVAPLMESSGGTWIAWDGVDAAHGLEGAEATRTLSSEAEGSFCDFVPVSLTAKEIQRYYYGFSNRALWPLAHLFITKSHFDGDHYQEYVRVNQKFAQATAGASRPGDRIWVHDYHLTLVPDLLRKANPKLGPIGFFWHIPFPPWDVFRVLPWKREILQGMIGADLIGFHLEDYADHFRESARRCLRVEQDGSDLVSEDGRRIRIGGFPIGIDVTKIETIAAGDRVDSLVRKKRERQKDRKVILSVDRLDYSKGILERLAAIERFFELYPERRRAVEFIQIAVPSRTRVEEYRAVKRHIEEAVGRINGRYTDEGWLPLRYLYRSFPLNQLIAYYRSADVALVTPVRDGMNLVAMEYVVSQLEQPGALVLSELAGVAQILEEAFLVNPFHTQQVAEGLEAALVASDRSKRARMQRMQKRVREHDVFGWHDRFWGALKKRRAARRSSEDWLQGALGPR